MGSLDYLALLKSQFGLGLNILAIEQKKSKNGAPSYHYKKTLLTSSCSISHHGNFGAYSFEKA